MWKLRHWLSGLPQISQLAELALKLRLSSSKGAGAGLRHWNGSLCQDLILGAHHPIFCTVLESLPSALMFTSISISRIQLKTKCTSWASPRQLTEILYLSSAPSPCSQWVLPSEQLFTQFGINYSSWNIWHNHWSAVSIHTATKVGFDDA